MKFKDMHCLPLNNLYLLRYVHKGISRDTILLTLIFQFISLQLIMKFLDMKCLPLNSLYLLRHVHRGTSGTISSKLIYTTYSGSYYGMWIVPAVVLNQAH